MPVDHFVAPENSLEPVRYDIIEMLQRAASDKSHPWRYPTVASVDQNGAPQARVMIVRDFDGTIPQIRIFTDARSPKFAELSANPDIQLVFYDPGAKLHLRASGTAKLHVRDDVTNACWNALPEFGRGDYLSRLPPGAAITSPEDALQDDSFGSENFAVIDIELTEADWLSLSANGHKRARLIWRDGKCEGRWITP